MKAAVLDANVLLRFFLLDDPKPSAAAVSLFEKAAEDQAELYLADIIVGEVTFVMDKVYRKNRIQIADALLDLVQNTAITWSGPTGTMVSIEGLGGVRAGSVDQVPLQLAPVTRAGNRSGSEGAIGCRLSPGTIFAPGTSTRGCEWSGCRGHAWPR